MMAECDCNVVAWSFQDTCASTTGLGIQIYKRTNNLSESEPRLTNFSKGYMRGQNFSVPLHDNNRPYRTVATGLIKVQPDRCGPGIVKFLNDGADPSLPKLPANVSCQAANGCMLSASANRTYYIGVGDYFLETQASVILSKCYDFHVTLLCTGGAETASPADSDPLGFSVDANTGAITGTPQKVRNGYRMKLRAVDAEEVRADVAQWTFDVVKAPAFSLNATSGWSAEAHGRLASKYHVSEAYILPKPSLGTAELLQHPAGDRFDEIVYLLSVDAAGGNLHCNAVGASKMQGISALTDVATGEGAINIKCTGNYSAKLVVRDGAGAEVTVRLWNFTVRRRDTDVAEHGPNGQGCANGVAEDGELMDSAFTCNCDGTKFTGDNCAALDADVGDTTAAVIGAVLAVLLLAICVVLLLLRWQRYKRSMMATDFREQLQAMQKRGEVNEAQTSAGGVPRELKRTWLALIDTLGKGAFGEVWKGLLQDAGNANIPAYMVACKVVKEASGGLDSAGAVAAEEELLKEALLMAQVTAHEHLVSLVGVVTRGNPKVLVLSFCEHGELQGALKKRAADGDPFSSAEKCNFCKEIADGMAHLAQHNFVHRDLAARNVLLGSGMVCKVADFGLSRRVQTEDNTGDYYRSSSGVVPVRWTAPEGISSQKFSSASDVWSFGITCMEIFQDGAAPYPGIKSNPEVIKLICTQGQVHPRPEGCTERVYSELLRCWSFDPAQRPDFGSLKAGFLALVTQAASRPGSATAVPSGVPVRAGETVASHPTLSSNGSEEVHNLGFQATGAGGRAGDHNNLGYQEDPGGCAGDEQYDLGYQDPGTDPTVAHYDLGCNEGRGYDRRVAGKAPAQVPLQIAQPPLVARAGACMHTDASAKKNTTSTRRDWGVGADDGADGGAPLLQFAGDDEPLANTAM